MITGLKYKEAVLLGDTIQMKLPYGSYEVDGVGIEGGREIVIAKDSTINEVRNLGTVITHYYQDDEDQSTISLEEYDKILQGSRGDWDDDLEEYTYKDLDHEFECRKKIEELGKWKPSKVDQGVEKTPFEYFIVGSLEDTGSPFIESPIIYGQLSWKGGRSFYKCNLSAAACSRYNEYEEKYKTSVNFSNNTGRTYLRFAQVNSSYVFSDKSPFKENSIVYTDTLEKARSLVAEAVKEVDRVLGPIVHPIELGKEDAGMILQKVRKLRESAMGLDTKQRSSTSKSYMLKELGELQDKLTAIVDSGLEDL